ncbi:uncharacterized protein LOC135702575 [Ochlerotatus camptorhynchus]|uniref:uncharacterized protein LOC135702575 n=1 Tax=Ochlerotatus camptorhynchus TaxID=644619 RepID=UPI0031DFF984
MKYHFCRVALVLLQIIFAEALSSEDVIERHKRTLLLTTDSATGILAAIAIPVDKQKPAGVDIFCSYNFEMNYGMTQLASDWTDPFKRFRVEQTENGLADSGAGGGERRKRQSLGFRQTDGITRRRMYHVIEEQLWASGYDGRKCLLRAVCEASSVGLHKHNGVLGDLIQLILRKGYNGRSCLLRTICEAAEAKFSHSSGVLGELLHILFTPSTTDESTAEELDPNHEEYKRAETLAYRNSPRRRFAGSSVCSDMYAECPFSLLDLFSGIL